MAGGSTTSCAARPAGWASPRWGSWWTSRRCPRPARPCRRGVGHESELAGEPFNTALAPRDEAPGSRSPSLRGDRMKRLKDRNQATVGGVTLVVIVLAVLAAFNADNLPI